MKKYLLFALLGGAFITLLTSNNTFAESYNIGSRPLSAYFLGGCNTVSSKKGYLTIGNRGSLLSSAADLGTKNGCGYYIDNSGGEYQVNYDRTFIGYTHWNDTNYIRSTSGTELDSYLTLALQGNYIDRITGMNLKTNLQKIEISNNNTSYPVVPASGSESYGYMALMTGFFIPSGSWTNYATLNISNDVSLAWQGSNNSYTSFTTAEKQKFIKDVYDHSYLYTGDPKDYLPESYYEQLKVKLGISSDENWNNFTFQISYLPSYTTGYSFSSLTFLCGELCQNSYPSSLQFAQMYGFGFEANIEGITHAQRGVKWNADFVNLSPNYLAYSNDLWKMSYQKFFFDYIIPEDTDAYNVMAGLAGRVSTSNNFKTSGWNDIVGSNPGQSWWGNIFNLSGLLFPFQSFFAGFTDSQCVAIPTIGGMLGLGANQQYCSWWSSSIRSILTPVFSVSAILLLFGFIINWLRNDGEGLSSDDKINLNRKGGK